MKTFQQHAKPPFEIETLPEHFDSIDAVQMEEYYDMGIICQLIFKKDINMDEEAQRELFSELMDRLILRTDSSNVTILCPNFDLEIPKGNAKFGTVREFLKSLLYSLDNMPSAIKEQLSPKIGVFKEIVENEDFVPDWFKLIIEDPLGNSRIQCKKFDIGTDENGNLTFVDYFKNDPHVSVDLFHRSEGECVEFDLILDNEQRPHTLYGEEAFDKVLELLSHSQKIVGLTGAGVSVESGISAFRNSGSSNLQNIWDKWNQDEMTYQNILGRKKIRDDYFEMHAYLKEQISKAFPNPSHQLFSVLNDQGKLLRVITQNIDGMHQRAGLPESKVIEIHGSSKTVVCTKCHQLIENPNELYEKVKEHVKRGEEIPNELTTCSTCGGILKPNTVSFGEALRHSELVDARQMCRECDLLIVMGTRLLVEPVNTLPKLASRRGIPVVIINMEATPFDKNCVAILQGKAGEWCQQIINKL
ncbi:hypothetical protein C9374_003350 [Naegleria lovaniensis]|uniref:Deacetylase sirtuin-type domain-containing protein n=1 Tax=Naegleria lovaniensis TaxID=51637 RepID=A0AA88GMQ4_NAELO|nr:uncharacterized protein C9374_003350 [Naegleria lovaniensis]KAG2385535.1 hypothetical protein C9374_003350 [Naegleria lovaniensis]